jgi:hypothetical protein
MYISISRFQIGSDRPFLDGSLDQVELLISSAHSYVDIIVEVGKAVGRLTPG